METKGLNGLGSTLAFLRKEKVKTLKELASMTGLSVSYISAIENGKKTPDLQVVERISSALKTPLHLLLFKAAIEEQVAPEKRRLVRDFKPILKKMEQLARELYSDDDDDDDNGNQEVDSILPNQPKNHPMEEMCA